MSYEQKEGQGSLFMNEKTNDKQPDFVGDALFEGKKIKISAWKRTSKNGKHYLSLSVQKPQESQKNTDKKELNDDISW